MVFLDDFYERRRQAARYLRVIYAEQKRSEGSRRGVESVNVLKAGFFLVLYNLVEAAARSSFESVQDQIKAEAVPFERLRESIRRSVVTGFKKYASPDRDHAMKDVSVDIVTGGLSIEDLFKGNVDARLLRGMCDRYGISTQTERSRTWNGRDLLTIKENRNDLAHGLKTYDEVGRAYSTQDIARIYIRSSRYIESILLNVRTYLDASSFQE
ncbi:MAG: hypothetical protein IAI50_19035 [Candidatus Eremiobacteraeota bacterium]|nr:hypothetical protein [Candidatus Eremiobacteraeota bacterium]